ncbi:MULTISPECIES: GNAT family N-acetyltransferase [Priestia]|uniref:GNAT family N-acetyltransferase n=3 Tax=Priestia TaxID=2800373 RepID=A0AAX6BNW8_PRIMG|nr:MULTISPECIES: GNAT family N-acetyltransferase [Priestia]MBK0293902.1 GNAT family N-acetyltransferase [Bacillus sp. S34]MCL9636178.1 GNAT family N-acetyltransferase [Bacillus zanthoxyli]UPK51272.1 GNAT family N-acetyltransferase [Bacillus sp. H8-1]AWD63787.1 N-acetyltransferase [Priestia megaterium]MBY0075072.1 GNAT family N-acetyltransferase [Priestia aryabhattai]
MIAKATEEEIQEIRTKSADALFEGTTHQFQPSTERVNELIDNALEKGCYYLVSRQENKLAGWVFVGPSADFFSKAEIGFIYELYVLPEYRGQGLAKPLMQKAIDELSIKGYPEIRLSVHAGNFAQHVYRELGFVDKQISMSLQVAKRP